jgi:hypothetical protein
MPAPKARHWGQSNKSTYRADPEVVAWRRWCIAVLAVTVAALGAVAAVNATVDPFQQYRLTTSRAPRFYALHHRWINPGLARNASYDTALIGSSIMESTRNDAIAAACGGPAVNLSMPAISAAEMRTLLGTVFAGHDPRRVLLVLDFNAFAGTPDERQESAGPLPAYLYDRSVLDDLPYLLSGTVLRKSLSALLGRRDEPFTDDPNAPWYWADRMRFGRDNVLRDLDLGNLNARFQQPARSLAGMRASFAHNVLPILRAHPETTFDLVWPPYSILVWLDFAQRGQLDVTFDFKRHVIAATAGLPNVRVVDLQAHGEITTDLDRYMDIYHFSPDVNRWIVERACAGEDRVDAGSVDAFEQQLRGQIAAWQPPTTHATR